MPKVIHLSVRELIMSKYSQGDSISAIAGCLELDWRTVRQAIEDFYFSGIRPSVSAIINPSTAFEDRR